MNIHKKFQLAFKHYEAGNLQESVSICKEILRRKPREIAVLHFLGIVYQQLKDYDVAIKYLQTALQLDQNSSEGLYNLGRAFENNGEPERAVDCYQKVIKLNPKCVDAF